MSINLVYLVVSMYKWVHLPIKDENIEKRMILSNRS